MKLSYEKPGLLPFNLRYMSIHGKDGTCYNGVSEETPPDECPELFLPDNF